MHLLVSKTSKHSEDRSSKSEGSDANKPQLTTGLLSSSKHTASNAKNKRIASKKKKKQEDKRGRTATKSIHRNPPEFNKVLPSLADIKVISKPSEDADLPVDVLLLTVEDCEFLACYSELKNPYRCYFDALGYVYFSEVDKSQEEVRVALLRCHKHSSSPGGSLTSVKNAATVLGLKAVISVGACSGLYPEKFKLGDVVVSAKLATYESKVVTNNQEQSTGVRNCVSRRFLDVIKNCADGWQAPLKNPADAQKVQVYNTAEFLSGPEQVSAQWRRDQLAETYPQAIAIENDGVGKSTDFFLLIFCSQCL